MALDIEVRFLGVFRGLSGKTCVHVKMEEPTNVRKVIQKLVEAFSPEFKRVLIDSELEDPRPNALILVNGKEINSDFISEKIFIEENEVLVIMG